MPPTGQAFFAKVAFRQLSGLVISGNIDLPLPFTISHVAAILPIPRRRLSLSALVIGSMVPDFPHLFFRPDISQFGHTLPGLFLVSVPLGLAALLLFHFFLKEPLLSLSPDPIRMRYSLETRFAFLPLSRLAWLTLAVLIGVTTHVLWDGFTHAQGFFVVHWPVLLTRTPCWPHRPLCGIIQVLSSIVGLALTVFVFVSWLRKAPRYEKAIAPPATSNSMRMIWLCAGIVVAVSFGSAYGYLAQSTGQLGALITLVLYGSMTATLAEAMMFSVWWNLRKLSPAV